MTDSAKISEFELKIADLSLKLAEALAENARLRALLEKQTVKKNKYK